MRKVKIFPKRGIIYDRNKQPLAINVQTYNIFIIPKFVKNIKKTVRTISKAIPELKYERLLKKIGTRKKFTWLGRKLKLNEVQTKLIKDMKNVYLEQHASRYYPNNELLSQTLGFVGIDNSGLSGIEYQFDKELKGESHIIKYFKDAKGRPITMHADNKGKESKSITLTVDKELQSVLEMHLKDGIDKHKALRGGAAVMDAETGEILAMANYPSFDPNHYRKSKQENRRLSFVTDPIEPGSTFKTVTISSALENNIINMDTNYYCERGKLKVGNHTIREAESTKGFEWLSVSEILKYSSNIGTTKIAFDLTFPKLKKTMDMFGFGQKTGIELPGESRGIYPNKKNVTPLSLSNISFGQGLAVNGVQLLSFYSSIANGGYLVTPTIIHKKKYKKREKVLSDNTVRDLTAMLVDAVENGTGSRAKIDYFKIAGKTSTAQKSKNGKYDSYIGGFIGFPVNVNKKFVVYTYVDSPTVGGYYGNIVAGPIFRKISEFLLFKNKAFQQITTIVAKKKNTNIDKIRTTLSSKRNLKAGYMPNLIGLDKVSLNKFVKSLKLKISMTGFGVVTEQYPKAGARISKGELIKLKLKAPHYE